MDAWITLRNKNVEFLVNFFNRLLRGKKMPGQIIGGGACSYLKETSKVKETSKNVKITGGSS